MKSISQCLAFASFASSVLAGSSSPRKALLYTYDAASTDSEKYGTSVSLDEVQLIVDSRLGTNMKQSIGKDAPEELLHDLNVYGGQQRTLLADTTTPSLRKLGVVLEGWDFTASDFSTPHIVPTLRVQDIGGKNLHEEMVLDSQSQDLCSFSRQSKSGLKMDVQLKYKNCADMSDETVFGSDSTDGVMVESILNNLASPEEVLLRLSFPKDSNDRISKVLKGLDWLASVGAEQEVVEATILVVPSTRSSRKSNTLLPRRLPQEEPLDTSLPAKVEEFVAPLVAGNYTPLPISNTKIPRCFSTQSACQSGTNNCSTHGQCTLYHSITDGDDSSGSDCWSCTCGKTSSGNGKGGVVNWGGNACQKKDISVPFWLFAGFAISMTAGIAGAIGMLYGMGSQDLPGVLGAGVGGTKASR